MKLRELTKKDLPVINKWRNDKNITDSLSAPYRFINIETDEKWFEDYQINKHTQLRFIIEENNKVIGMVSLIHIDNVSRNAEFAIMIGEQKYQNKGIGTSVIKSTLGYAFESMNLHKVYLHVLEGNSRARKVYKNVGFVEEGVLREVVFKNGVYKDLLVMGMLKRDYLKRNGNKQI